MGYLTIHASAVRMVQGGVAFLGDTGSGKSTLAAHFLANGHDVLSDDAVVVGVTGSQPSIEGTYRSLRLWPDSASRLLTLLPDAVGETDSRGKRRIRPADNDARPGGATLSAVYLLSTDPPGREGSVAVSPVSPRECCIAIVKSSFQLNPADPQRAAALLSAAARLAEDVPAFFLRYERRYDVLTGVRRAVMNRWRC
jgi:hypothetical protein